MNYSTLWHATVWTCCHKAKAKSIHVYLTKTFPYLAEHFCLYVWSKPKYSDWKRAFKNAKECTKLNGNSINFACASFKESFIHSSTFQVIMISLCYWTEYRTSPKMFPWLFNTTFKECISRCGSRYMMIYWGAQTRWLISVSYLVGVGKFQVEPAVLQYYFRFLVVREGYDYTTKDL